MQAPSDVHDEVMTSTPAPTPAPALDRFFTTLRRSPVTRSQDRVVAGVSAGVAERLGVSTAIVRIATVVLAIFGPAVVVYLAAWLLLPDSQGRIRLERAIRGGEASSIILLVVAALAILPDLFGRNAGLHHAGPWPFLIVAGLVVVGFKKGWWQRGNRGQWSHAERPSSSSAPEGPQDAPRV